MSFPAGSLKTFRQRSAWQIFLVLIMCRKEEQCKKNKRAVYLEVYREAKTLALSSGSQARSPEEFQTEKFEGQKLEKNALAFQYRCYCALSALSEIAMGRSS